MRHSHCLARIGVSELRVFGGGGMNGDAICLVGRYIAEQTVVRRCTIEEGRKHLEATIGIQVFPDGWIPRGYQGMCAGIKV